MSSNEVNAILQRDMMQYIGYSKPLQEIAFGRASYPQYSPAKSKINVREGSIKFVKGIWKENRSVWDREVNDTVKKEVDVIGFTFDLKLGSQKFPMFIEVKEDYQKDTYMSQLDALADGSVPFGTPILTKDHRGTFWLSLPCEYTPANRTKKVKTGKFLSIDLGERNTAVGVVMDSYNPRYQLKKIVFGLDNEFQSLRTGFNELTKRSYSARRDKKELIGHKKMLTVKNLVNLSAKRLVSKALSYGCEYLVLENLTGKKLWKAVPVGALITRIEQVCAKENIGVIAVDPKGTSQECSCCRKKTTPKIIKTGVTGLMDNKTKKPIPFGRYQKHFVCGNNDCEKYGVLIDADFNASINIGLRGKKIILEK